jgi:hypothetical protein
MYFMDKGPHQFTRARYDTEIAFPKNLTDLSSLKLDVVDATVEIGEMPNLFIDKFSVVNTNGSVDAKVKCKLVVVLRLRLLLLTLVIGFSLTITAAATTITLFRII